MSSGQHGNAKEPRNPRDTACRLADLSIIPHRGAVAMGAGVLGLLLYILTCAPGVLWQDSAMFQFRVRLCDLPGDLGLALAHPLYILLARAFTLLPLGGDFAFRVNLFSAVCGAATLVFTVDLLMSLTRSRTAAISGTILLAVSHTFWTHAVIAEVYELYALGLVAELWLLERFFRRREIRWLIIALLVNGLNVSNHVLAVLHAPAYVGVTAWAARERLLRGKLVALLVLAFLVGTTPYLYLIIREIADGRPILQTLWYALAGPPDRSPKVIATSFPLVHQCKRAVQYFAMNFPTPPALLAPLGAWAAWKDSRARWFFAVGGAVFILNFVFAFRYMVADQFVFFTPCYVIFALCVALGTASLLRRARWIGIACLVLSVLPVVVYEIAPPLLERYGVSIGVKREIPGRDSYTYFLRPRKSGEISATEFARAALGQAAPDGLLLADVTIKNLLVYARDIEGLHPGVTLNHGHDTTPALPVIEPIPDEVKPFADRGKAYICSNHSTYVPDWIQQAYDLEPAGPVFRLRPKVCRPSAPGGSP